MRRPTRNHKAATKAKVALATLDGDQTLAELGEKYNLIFPSFFMTTPQGTA